MFNIILIYLNQMNQQILEVRAMDDQFLNHIILKDHEFQSPWFH